MAPGVLRVFGGHKRVHGQGEKDDDPDGGEQCWDNGVPIDKIGDHQALQRTIAT